MKFSLAAIVLACLAESTAALPHYIYLNRTTSLCHGGNLTFSVQQVQNSHFKGYDGAGSLIQAFAKYAKGFPSPLQQAIRINPELNRKFGVLLADGDKGTGSVSAMPPPMYDSEYVIPVQIGMPPQTIPLNLDTGSADLWAISTDTDKDLVFGQTLYHPNRSTAMKHIDGESWMVKYGDDSSASGIVYQDRVQVGETSFASQAVQSAIKLSHSMSEDAFSSGVLGLGRSKANTVSPHKQLTYMDNIKGQLEAPIFTANLQRGRPGNYNFGFINQSEYTGALQYTNIKPDSMYWEITVDGHQVGKEGKYQTSNWSAIVDTGTTLLLTPQKVADDYYSQVSGAGIDPRHGMTVMPCNATLPDFVFGLDTYRGTIPGHYIKYSKSNQTHCFGGIQVSQGMPFGVLGDILLKAQFVVFDAGQNRVGFANKATDPSTFWE